MRDQNAAPLSTWVSALKKGNVKVERFVFLFAARYDPGNHCGFAAGKPMFLAQEDCL
jgi:hypothetical protein